jgi:glycosyltransferase involved in cell wall biosynthesis
MKISVIGPVLNEAPWIGYSIMAALDHMHEFIYALDEGSNDGTRELLLHIKDKYAKEKLRIIQTPNFHPHDMSAYNRAFNVCIQEATGDAVMFLHPDMIITNPEQITKLETGPLAWTVNMTSFAGDFSTVITKGRAAKWKNIHAKKFGIHYYGGYGSQNEDFYHADITGRSYKHYGTEFSKYPFEVKDSGLNINHYCELKPYKRRLEKMKYCLKTQYPGIGESRIEEIAVHHPRVTLESSSVQYGQFEFTRLDDQTPEVIKKYEPEFTDVVKSSQGELYGVQR